MREFPRLPRHACLAQLPAPFECLGRGTAGERRPHGVPGPFLVGHAMGSIEIVDEGTRATIDLHDHSTMEQFRFSAKRHVHRVANLHLGVRHLTNHLSKGDA